MDYKIVFSDIDGTLLNSERELSERTIETIQKIKDKVPIVLISARMPTAMRHLQKQLGIEEQPIICYNGGSVIIDEKVVSSTDIPLPLLEDLAKFNKNHQVHLSLYQGEEWHVPEYDYWAKREEKNTKVTPTVTDIESVIEDWNKRNLGVHKIMCMGDEAKVEKIMGFLTEKYGEDLHLYRSKPTYIEVANKKISKLTAIKHLLDNHFHYSLDETIAFGDNYNDVAMLEGVGMGIAVGNARPEAKEVANKVTAPSIEDGVAKSLEEIFLR